MNQDELPGIQKKRGRPKTSPVSRKEQLRIAAQEYRKRKKAAFINDDASTKIVYDVESVGGVRKTVLDHLQCLQSGQERIEEDISEIRSRITPIEELLRIIERKIDPAKGG